MCGNDVHAELGQIIAGQRPGRTNEARLHQKESRPLPEELTAGQSVPGFEQVGAPVDGPIQALEKGLSKQSRLAPELVQTHFEEIHAEKIKVGVLQ